ncbi:MAG TPA: HAMP domain-containing sensor histidine kinase [Pyrinomonadaceae bacterium]|nr:HAMP domain-containing sensor histidine kinase [Pyrinomonadaceae bacterium]
MRNNRRGVTIFFLIFGICLIVSAIALQVGWILFSLERVAVLIFGIIFFSAIITGLVLNTIFLIREIRRNEQQNAFLNAVTHELKTPIASIKLYLETLKTRDLSEEKRQHFYDIMLADNARLLNTVEQVLQASRTRESQENLRNFVKIELNPLLEEAVSIVRTRYNLPDDALNFTKNDSVLDISGDRNELLSVFTNLLDNAVKYSKEKIKVTVRARNLDRKTIIIRIRDEGIGIPAGELKRVFKRFYRVANVTTQKQKGTGLGLFIVQSIIKNHGGKIFVESDGEDKGSVFTIQLPKA